MAGWVFTEAACQLRQVDFGTTEAEMVLPLLGCRVHVCMYVFVYMYVYINIFISPVICTEENIYFFILSFKGLVYAMTAGSSLRPCCVTPVLLWNRRSCGTDHQTFRRRKTDSLSGFNGFRRDLETLPRTDGCLSAQRWVDLSMKLMGKLPGFTGSLAGGWKSSQALEL